MTRKEFLSILAAGSAAPVLAQTVTRPAATPRIAASTKLPELVLPPVQPGPPYLMAGVMLGHVSAEEARFWVRATASANWKVSLEEVRDPAAKLEVPGPGLAADSGFTGVAVVSGLKAATRYRYQVLLDGREQLPRPLPEFSTAGREGESTRVRFGFGSCVGSRPVNPASTWGELAMRAKAAPQEGSFDFFLLLGDNHYGDTTDVEKLRLHYTAHRLSPGWREFAAGVPIYAIWDDHDYGPNNSDGTEPGKADSLRVFGESWANPGMGEPDNPGCYFTFARGDAQFFMLDCRYHRSPNDQPDGADKTMLGAGQMAWLKRELKASRATFKVLATGSEWQSHSQIDSWKVFRHERDALFAWIDEEKVEGVLLLSGDRHFSAGYHILNRFVEFTSGPLGSRNATLRANPERFTGHDEGLMWYVLELDSTPANPSLTFELWQTGGGLLERRTLSWAQLHGRAPIEPTPMPLRPGRMEAKPARPA